MSIDREQKKEQFERSEKKGGATKFIALVILLIAAAGIGWAVTGKAPSDGYAAIKSVNGEVKINISSVDDGQAHYFKYASPKGEVAFFVVKSVDGVMRAAFDACDVCYREKKGYRQEADFMVCNNCNMKFRTDLVNEVKGGCNPAPLERTVTNGQLVITDAALQGGAWYFGS